MLYAKAKYGNMDPYFCIKLQNWIFTNCFANVPLTCSVCLPMIYLKPICDLLNSRIQEMSCPITNLNPRTPKHLYDVLIHECGNIGCFVRLHRLSSTHLGKYFVATRTTVMTSSTSCLSYLCFLFLFPVFYKFGRAWYFFFFVCQIDRDFSTFFLPDMTIEKLQKVATTHVDAHFKARWLRWWNFTTEFKEENKFPLAPPLRKKVLKN